MLASISPLGEQARGNRWITTVTSYVVGSVAGGASLGAVAGAIGELTLRGVAGRSRLAVWGGACIVALVIDVLRGSPGIPRRQVDDAWLSRYRGWVYGSAFGYQLGLGIVTIVTTASVYVVVVSALLAPNFEDAVLIGTAFGLVRGLPQFATAHGTDPSRLRELHRIMQRWSRAVRIVCSASLATTGLAALTWSAVHP